MPIIHPMPCIDDMHFERASLVARTEPADAPLALRNARSGSTVAFEYCPADGTQRLNITCAGRRDALAQGRWTTEGAQPSPALAARAAGLSRDFPFDGGRQVYSIAVSAEGAGGDVDGGSEEGGSLVIDVTERRVGPPSVRSTAKAVLRRAAGAIFALMSARADRDGTHVLFFSQTSETPRDNLAALRRRMSERGMEENFDVTVRCRNALAGARGPAAWLGDLRAIARSDVIFIDNYAPVFGWIELDEDVTLVQVWHAGVGVKALGYARFGQDGGPDPHRSPHRAATFAIAGCEALRDTYAEVFGIERESVIATGLPRLDHFTDDDVATAARAGVLARKPALAGRRVILFAPTFRGTGQQDAHWPADLLDKEALCAIAEMCVRTNSIFAVKMHPFVRSALEVPPSCKERIVDVADEETADLFHVADVLVTDYSSCWYDYQLLGRPIVLFTPDRADFEATHGVQRPVAETAPGPVCDTPAELVSALERALGGSGTDAYGRPEELDLCAQRDGLASDRVLDAALG